MKKTTLTLFLLIFLFGCGGKGSNNFPVPNYYEVTYKNGTADTIIAHSYGERFEVIHFHLLVSTSVWCGHSYELVHSASLFNINGIRKVKPDATTDSLSDLSNYFMYQPFTFGCIEEEVQIPKGHFFDGTFYVTWN
jgi:hypothetical protein